jgi:hypothetical protein
VYERSNYLMLKPLDVDKRKADSNGKQLEPQHARISSSWRHQISLYDS